MMDERILIGEKKNISYRPFNHEEYHFQRHLLDIYYPDNYNLNPVLIFIHGGTWINGSKDVYHTLGCNFAMKGICCVIINYRLGDLVNVFKMAEDCAAAVNYVYENIVEFGGNKDDIAISGHSAGGHLASLITLDNSYFTELNVKNPIKKTILIDAFGLNIGSFIEDHDALNIHQIEELFTKDPFMWKKASPVSFINKDVTPFLILLGENTYPFLKKDNELFCRDLSILNPYVVYKSYENVSHLGMMSQMENPNNEIYDDIINFIHSVDIIHQR